MSSLTGLTERQVEVLGVVYKSSLIGQPVTRKFIAGKIGTSETGASQTAGSLTRRGLLTKTKLASKVVYSTTQEGATLWLRKARVHGRQPR